MNAFKLFLLKLFTYLNAEIVYTDFLTSWNSSQGDNRFPQLLKTCLFTLQKGFLWFS